MIVEDHAAHDQSPWVVGRLVRFGMEAGFEGDTVFSNAVVAIVKVKSRMRPTVTSKSQFRRCRTENTSSLHTVLTFVEQNYVSSRISSPLVFLLNILQFVKGKYMAVVCVSI